MVIVLWKKENEVVVSLLIIFYATTLYNNIWVSLPKGMEEEKSQKPLHAQTVTTVVLTSAL